ncbi:hypothetical protein HQ447_14290 [bacterium]|nr:hypothetical protein [bacterium]
MASSTPDDSLLLIRCPSCGQRFKVGDDLRERTVECGGCEHRFRIDDEVIVRGRKFYPSERKSQGLGGFHRVPLPRDDAFSGVQPMRYGNLPDPAVLEPASPQRVIAGFLGVLGIVLMALFFMFGGSRGGALDGMVLMNRFLMAGFVSLLGVVMLVYANPRARGKALGVGLLLSCGLLAVPYFFRAGSVPLPSHAGTPSRAVTAPVTENGAPGVPEASSITELRTRIGTGPLVAEIARLAQESSRKQAMGIWLRGLSDSQRFLVKDYLLRVTGADSSSHYYPRSGGDYLLVLSGIDTSLPELALTASALGEVERTYPEISVIEVRVRSEVFVEGPIEKLSNKDDPEFYELNKKELESIDLERVKRAVQRLAEAEPKLYRNDISRKLISLLGQDEVNFKGNVCSALGVWSEVPGPAGDAALKVVKQLFAQGKMVPPEIVQLIVREKNPAVIPVLDELWFKNPMDWEALYGDLGPPVEATVLRRFAETKGTIRYSAVRILGRVGGADSLPILAAGGAGADAELKVLLEQAQRSIRTRLGH